MVNKYLEKISTLIKDKRLVSKISPKGFGVKAKGKADLDASNRIHTLHETVERQVAMGLDSVKHRLKFGDGSQGFIRGTKKGVRSRLYRK